MKMMKRVLVATLSVAMLFVCTVGTSAVSLSVEAIK